MIEVTSRRMECTHFILECSRMLAVGLQLYQFHERISVSVFVHTCTVRSKIKGILDQK